MHYLRELKKQYPSLFAEYADQLVNRGRTTRAFKLRRKALLVGDPRCKNCGTTDWRSFRRDGKACLDRPWPGYCSLRCIHTDPSVHEKARQTCLRAYGTSVSSRADSVKRKMRQTNVRRRGVPYTFQDESVKRRIRRTMRERHGVENPQQSPSIRKRTMTTCLDRYGFSNAAQNPEVIEKKRLTVRRRWGVDHYWQSAAAVESRKRTCLEVYGTESASQSAEVKRRTVENYRRRYGLDHRMHDPEIFARCMSARFRIRPTNIGGREFLLQGYEPACLRYLVQRHEAVILEAGLSGCQPKPYYRFRGKRRLYTPDAYVSIHDALYVVEVKSTWTLGVQKNNDPRVFAENRAKALAAEADGHQYILVVKHRKRFLVFRGFPTMEQVHDRL